MSSPVALADIALGSDMRRGSLGPLPRNGVEAWPEPVTGALLLNDMARTLRRFVVLPEAARDARARGKNFHVECPREAEAFSSVNITC